MIYMQEKLLARLEDIEYKFLKELEKESFFLESGISVTYFKEHYSFIFIDYYVRNIFDLAKEFPNFMHNYVNDSLLYDKESFNLYTAFQPYLVFRAIINEESENIYSEMLTEKASEDIEIEIEKMKKFLKLSQRNYCLEMIKSYSKQRYEDINYIYDNKELYGLCVSVSKTNLEGIITYVSEDFEKISGYTKHELLGANHNIIRHEDTEKELFVEMWETISNKNIWKGKLKNKKKNGKYYWVESIIIPILNNKDELVEYLSLRREVTELTDLKACNKNLYSLHSMVLEVREKTVINSGGMFFENEYIPTPDVNDEHINDVFNKLNVSEYVDSEIKEMDEFLKDVKILTISGQTFKINMFESKEDTVLIIFDHIEEVM